MRNIFLAILVVCSLVMFGHSALAIVVHATASIEIVPNSEGVRPLAGGGFVVSGSTNNAQVAYIEKDSTSSAGKVQYAILGNGQKYTSSKRFSVQYE